MPTVLLVRHADIKQPPTSADPPLTAAGQDRAEALAHVAAAAGVTAIWTSTLQRTKQTVQPLAAQLGVQPQVVPDDPDLFRAAVAAAGVSLVVGHSNTVPAMMAVLGVPTPLPVIGGTEFDNLFVVTVTGPGAATAVRLRYGKPSVSG